jgi:hypothetical protein
MFVFLFLIILAAIAQAQVQAFVVPNDEKSDAPDISELVTTDFDMIQAGLETLIANDLEKLDRDEVDCIQFAAVSREEWKAYFPDDAIFNKMYSPLALLECIKYKLIKH